MTTSTTSVNEFYHDALYKLIRDKLPPKNTKQKNLNLFLKSVNDLCITLESEKEQIKSLIRPSERRYTEVNAQLKEEIIYKRDSINKLMEAISKLDMPSNFIPPNFEEDNLYEIAVFIKKLLVHQKGIEIQLRKAKEDAENASKAKTEFLSMMSHELRTPLNGIVSMTYLLEQENNNPKMVENLKILQFSTENLYNLINDVLDFNKIEAGKITLDEAEFNIKDLILKITQSVQSNLSTKNIKLILNIDNKIPTYLIGDPLRLSQVFNNLLNNAIKFTEKGKIVVTLQMKKMMSDYVSINFSIKDTGIGMSKEEIPIIFEKFTQANNQISRKFGGTGLGLGISKKILELYNSTIQVDSELNKGTNFYFNLNLKIANQKPLVNSKVEINNEKLLTGVKILLVEDYQMNIRIATMFLEKWGMVYDIATNGRIAVEKVLQNNYQLVLMDLSMPEMDGYEATMNIRKFDKKTPIIALTASALNIQDKVYEVGMNDYVTKPFNPKDLFHKIYQHALKSI